MSNIKLDTAKLDAIIKNARPQAARIVQSFSAKITGEAAANAPVDTGALRNSITSESHAEGDLNFIVQDGVEYGIFQELGTHRMAAQPFLIPAVLANEADYLAAFAELFK